jgi:ribulose-phosphate 3-epimerase
MNFFKYNSVLMKSQLIQIIPSINTPNFVEAKARIKKVEPYAKGPDGGKITWCHIDITDGIFSKYLLPHRAEDIAVIETPLNIEVHLMIVEPDKVIDQWLVKPVKRVIVHLEATPEPEVIIKKCHAAGVEIGFAVNPETPWEKLKPWFDKVDIVQVLAVHPGPAGQKMESVMLDKIAAIRSACPACSIEIDGGVDGDTAEAIVRAGTNLLVTGSYIFNAPDLKKAIETLTVIIRSPVE